MNTNPHEIERMRLWCAVVMRYTPKEADEAVREFDQRFPVESAGGGDPLASLERLHEKVNARIEHVQREEYGTADDLRFVSQWIVEEMAMQN